MLLWTKKFEMLVVRVLIVMMGVVLALAVIDLGWLIIKDIVESRYFLLSVEQLLELFGLFLLVLIGLELLETVMKTYITQGQPHHEVVLIVAIIAVARKVIIMDVKQMDGFVLLGVGGLIVGLTVGYFLMKKINGSGSPRANV